jgi:hypothetical protein
MLVAVGDQLGELADVPVGAAHARSPVRSGL